MEGELKVFRGSMKQTTALWPRLLFGQARRRHPRSVEAVTPKALAPGRGTADVSDPGPRSALRQGLARQAPAARVGEGAPARVYFPARLRRERKRERTHSPSSRRERKGTQRQLTSTPKWKCQEKKSPRPDTRKPAEEGAPRPKTESPQDSRASTEDEYSETYTHGC